MKKEGMILLVISILIISSVSLVSAESNETEIDEELAGITPDSAFYGLDVFVDNTRATLTPSSLGRAKIRLDIMEERMAEMEEMANKNKTAEANRAELEVQKQMQKFESSVEKIKKKDAPELNAYIQNYNARLEERKRRLVIQGEPDYADAIAEAIKMLEEVENVIVNIPEDLDSESRFKLSVICEEAGATTVEECKELISSGALVATFRRIPEGSPPDPHNCSGSWRSFVKQTKWCCDDSDGTYSPEYVEDVIMQGHIHMLDYYYRKGTVEYKIINLRTEEVEEGIETDSCDGDTLTEWFCPKVMDPITRNERFSDEYDCPLGCQNGACISEEGPEEIVECTDSDGGKDYFVKGTTTGKSLNNNVVGSQIDHCLVDATLGEFFCGDNNLVGLDAYTCPNGCQDGACISS